MSEWKWIDRKEREPERSEKVLILFCDGDIETAKLEFAERWPWSHWMPIPPVPPKMMTIEISERAVAAYAERNNTVKDYEEIAAACRRALEGK